MIFKEDPFAEHQPDPNHPDAAQSLVSQNMGNQHAGSPLIHRAYNTRGQVPVGVMSANQAGQQRQNAHPHGHDNTTPMAAVTQAQVLRTNPYMNNGVSVHHGGVTQDANLAALASNFGNLNVRATSYGSAATTASQLSGVPANYSHYPGMQLGTNQPWAHNQHVVYSSAPLHMGMNQTTGIQHPGMYAPPNPYIQHANYQTYGHGMDHQSPFPNNFTPRGPSGEMPALITPRRDSISSNEAENLPGTPFTYHGHYPNSVSVLDRSPSAPYALNGTPSPTQLMPGYGMVMNQFPKSHTSVPVALSPHLSALLEREPKIPAAIPAPSSPIKPLDRSLENKHGETNVYIRGLAPETSDEILHAYGIRFGDIQSSKAIIEAKTGSCKGFGFVKYHNFEDAEDCIRGFHFLGYEVSFARESFYTKLKKFSDVSNTNLYVSNIPRSMNEHDLGLIFAPYKVMSARILRDGQGNGRGVGFARFETRDVCEDIIRIYNGKKISKADEEYEIQIRYSDTQEQKNLKHTTAAARQYRAAEFDLGVMQVRGLVPTTVTGLMPPVEQRSMMSVSTASEAGTEFEGHLRQDLGYIPRYTNPTLRFDTRRPPYGGVTLPAVQMGATSHAEPAYTDIKVEVGSADRPDTPVTAQSEVKGNNRTVEQD